MFNPMKILQLKAAWDKFSANHPKFGPFIKAVSAYGLQPGTVIEVSVTPPDGQTYMTNLKISESDLELFDSIKHLNDE